MILPSDTNAPFIAQGRFSAACLARLYWTAGLAQAVHVVAGRRHALPVHPKKKPALRVAAAPHPTHASPKASS